MLNRIQLDHDRWVWEFSANGVTGQFITKDGRMGFTLKGFVDVLRQGVHLIDPDGILVQTVWRVSV